MDVREVRQADYLIIITIRTLRGLRSGVFSFFRKEYRAKRISLFMRMLAGQEECLEFDPAVFTAFVEKVVVSGTKKDVRLRFVLRDGLEYI